MRCARTRLLPRLDPTLIAGVTVTIPPSSRAAPRGTTDGLGRGSGQNHVVVGWRGGGPSIPPHGDQPSVAVAGRLATDPLGSISAPTSCSRRRLPFVESGTDYRWGDYSATMVDPSDNMTMWTIQNIPVRSTGRCASSSGWRRLPRRRLLSCRGWSRRAREYRHRRHRHQRERLRLYDPGPGFPKHLTRRSRRRCSPSIQ